MAREYGFTQQERNQYFLPTKVYSSWGRDINSDFFVLYVYDLSGNLLISKIMGLNEVDFENDGDFIDINVGQHLRDLGFREGEYDVHYKFLRRLAGRERTVYVDSLGKVYDGKVSRQVINKQVRFFKDTGNQNDKSTQEELFIREMKYKLVETSPNRDEFILELDSNISNPEYRNEFVEMGQMIEYQPINANNSGLIKFDSKEKNILEFDIDDLDRGFTQNMVGGQIVIPNMFKVTGQEDVDNDDVDVDDDDLDSVDEIDYDSMTNAELVELANQGDDEANAELQERSDGFS